MIRSLALAQALSQEFRIVFLNGGIFPPSIPKPPDIEFIDLLPLGMSADGVLVSRNSELCIDDIKHQRRDTILQTFHSFRPDVVLVELFPFGRKKFAFELLPLLRTVKKNRPDIKVVCSVRDILVNQRKDQQRHDNRARWLMDRYFDTLLIHSDERFSSFSSSFVPDKPMCTPVNYTGFVVSEPRSNLISKKRRDIVVSAGGGIVGGHLFRTAVDAYSLIQHRFNIPMTIVAGPFLPEGEWKKLQERAKGCKGLTLHRSVPDLRTNLHGAALSVSQCGYNTSMDILQSKVPALLIPYSKCRENEQLKRAQQLLKLGAARMVAETELNKYRFAEEVTQLLDNRPKAGKLNLEMGGAARSLEVVSRLLNNS